MPGPQIPEEDPEAPQNRLTEAEFKEWVANRTAKADEERRQKVAQREADIAAGRIPIDELTGKELAEHHPEVFDGY